MVDKEKVITALRDVYDPEIGVNVVDLGLIKELKIDNDNVTVDMVLTIPGCPLREYMISQVRETVESVEGVKSVTVNLLDDVWSW
ncbi:MAG TPA: metal-sulfur cluster assembly factor [bacterium]|jgi:serine O-acetyltransferase|nr:metal-sulfur cluster assembly factor [Dictyoglomota bacterium]HHV81083.1 metal-sulfur cluster assembly factor [bacterium]HOK28982.1 metal-sulfur cluster assembly factor [bacterium]HOL54552.1 metal-sulfur cluster assembly factor [bacterium]HON72575.1 metal-sulfur cluster assembly factor [bacterium]